MERTHTIKFLIICASYLANIIQIKGSHNYYYGTISIRILSGFPSPRIISSSYEKTLRTRIVRPSSATVLSAAILSNQPTPCSLQYDYSKSTATGLLTGNIINVDHDEGMHERTGTLSTMYELDIENRAYQELLIISLAVSFFLFQAPSYSLAGENILSILRHRKLNASLFKGQIEPVKL